MIEVYIKVHIKCFLKFLEAHSLQIFLEILYHFIQFEQHVTFLIFRQISKITINREKIIGGVNENWVWRMTFELNEMVQYSIGSGQLKLAPS